MNQSKFQKQTRQYSCINYAAFCSLRSFRYFSMPIEVSKWDKIDSKICLKLYYDLCKCTITLESTSACMDTENALSSHPIMDKLLLV